MLEQGMVTSWIIQVNFSLIFIVLAIATKSVISEFWEHGNISTITSDKACCQLLNKLRVWPNYLNFKCGEPQ